VTSSRFSALSTAYLQLTASPFAGLRSGCLCRPGIQNFRITRTTLEDPAPFRLTP
jgi:hypothetical protein